MDKLKVNIEEDREGRSKDKMDEKFVIKTVPNCKNIFGFDFDQRSYANHVTIVNGCYSSLLNIFSLRF